jgi:alcohol dehydrogenase YqhD (iron-dependent ADH family)
MESDNEEKKSSSKLQQTSKVKFDLDSSQHNDDVNKSLDETDDFFEFLPLSNNPSSSSIDSTTNGTTFYTKPLLNNEKKLIKKRSLR